jgi:hypothetical protein
VTEEELHRSLLRFDQTDQTLLAGNHGSQDLVRLVRAKVRGLEPEIFGEVEGVGPAVDRRAIREIRRVPAAHRRKLVAQRLLEQARDHSAIGALADQLFPQSLVDALSRRGAGSENHD